MFLLMQYFEIALSSFKGKALQIDVWLGFVRQWPVSNAAVFSSHKPTTAYHKTEVSCDSPTHTFLFHSEQKNGRERSAKNKARNNKVLHLSFKLSLLSCPTPDGKRLGLDEIIKVSHLEQYYGNGNISSY